MKVYSRNISVESDSDMSGDECVEQFDEMLYRAAKEERLIRGVFQCAQVLETCPDRVTLCLLPTTTCEDISIHIQHKLIEAYCWENDIRVIKLDNVQYTNIAKVPRSKTGDQSEMECLLMTTEPVKASMTDDSTYQDDDYYG